MSASAQESRQVVVDAIDFQVPCRRFTIKANVTRDKQMPVVDEFVLRLLHVVQRITVERLAGYFGFSGSEMETVLLQLTDRGLIESDEREFYLSAKSYDLFKGLTEGELPRLAAVEEWTEGVWFELISRNTMTPARFRPQPNLLPIREQSQARQIPEAYAREAFEQNFHDYSRRVRRHPDADRLAIYSVSEVEAGIYGYQPMPAEASLELGASLESHLHVPLVDTDPGRFMPLSVAAVDAWATLVGPEASASGLADYERLTGDNRPSRLRADRTDPATWAETLASTQTADMVRLFGASYLDDNIEKLCQLMATTMGSARPAISPTITWLRPGGTAWGRTTKVGDALRRVRETLSANGIRDVQTLMMVSRGVPNTHRRHFKRVFDEGRLVPSGFYPADIEILLVPGIASLMCLYADIGRHGIAIGTASSSERMLRAIERRFSETVRTTSDVLWTVPVEERNS
jgi:hypothetical protein